MLVAFETPTGIRSLPVALMNDLSKTVDPGIRVCMPTDAAVACKPAFRPRCTASASDAPIAVA